MSAATRRRPKRSGPERQRGALLLGLLLVMALVSLSQLVIAESWRVGAQREREAQLLHVGEQYRRAIASYYRTVPPGGAPTLPTRIEDLLKDNRFPRPVAHLRQAWPDPFTGKNDWELIRAGNGLVGVHSKAEARPMKRTGFTASQSGFEDAKTVRDWRFVYVPLVAGTVRGAGVPPPPGAAPGTFGARQPPRGR